MVLKIEDKKRTLIIKKELKKLINQNLSNEYIEKFYIPIIDKIKNKKKLMIVGPQGSGKSTLSTLIQSVLLIIYGKKVVVLGLDDFYLRKSERLKLANNIHPLFEVRGVPGTHEIQLLQDTIMNLELKKFPVRLPSFDKLKDDRKRNYKNTNEVDLVIFEGWCVGGKPISQSYLKKNINSLETNQDPKRIWRNYYNNSLEKDYQKIFKKFKYMIFFQVPSFHYVYKWRLKQEEQLIQKKITKSSQVKIKNFIQYFQKLTIWM
ncbi:MAG: hypothetical protein O3C61_04765, partial [Proteobacteria bacterium]|nr:hypothetical protein [Pseudomonadota bacterium]